MTTIAGITHEGCAWLGGDSATSRGSIIQVEGIPKVFRRGEFLIGAAGDARINSLMQFVFPVPVVPTRVDLDSFMVTRFAENMRKCFEAKNYPVESEEGEAYNGDVLVAVRGCLYEIDANFAVSRCREPFNAIGEGAEAALGALYVTGYLEPEERLRLALETSSRVCGSVCAPFIIEYLGKESLMKKKKSKKKKSSKGKKKK